MKKTISSLVFAMALCISLLVGCRIAIPSISVGEPSGALSTEAVVQRTRETSSLNTAEFGLQNGRKRLTRNDVKNIALSHAGVNGNKVWDPEIELEHDRGAFYYELSFEAVGREYEYLIDAYTGEILHSKSEAD